MPRNKTGNLDLIQKQDTTKIIYYRNKEVTIEYVLNLATWNVPGNKK